MILKFLNDVKSYLSNKLFKSNCCPRMSMVRELTIDIYKHFGKDRIPLAASAISFYTLLSLFPLTLLALTISAPYLHDFFLQDDSIKTVLGERLFNALQSQIFSAVNKQAFPSTLASLIIGFWSGSQIFLILESAINLVWQVEKKRPFWKSRLLAFIMIIIVGTLSALAVLLVNSLRLLGRQEIPFWGHRVNELPLVLTSAFTIVIPLLIVTLLFAIIYRLMPARHVTTHAVLPGAMISGTLWISALHFFGWYTSHFPSTMLIYGSLSTIIMLLFFFYYSAFILLVGAEISAAYHRRLLQIGTDKEELASEEESGTLVAK